MWEGLHDMDQSTLHLFERIHQETQLEFFKFSFQENSDSFSPSIPTYYGTFLRKRLTIRYFLSICSYIS